ncbi:tail fiber protein [Pectobacterium carotovorum subsp. carotovorum]|nr:tail fiber protein [Pectobacterium carotovorum subsp. carotovorum]GLX54984.1 tail fiber protein [Pectobacterium carotovorum subsp. carotovorum]
MAQSIVTRAFEAWNVKKVLDGQPAVPDQIVFALNPNQDENQAVSRDEGMPAAAAIKHRAAITQSGVLNTNAVVYSVVLDTAIGDWDYNWIGLVDSKTNTVLMIVHVRTQQKIKTQNGRQGNSLTRNLAMQFDGAAAATQINVSAATWQIDFSARLFGMDEAHRLAMLDYYGAAAFLNDGFRVSLANGVATVMAGIGYVGGLRAQLDAPAMLNVSANTSVWLDVSRQGTVTGAWENRITFTAATALANYTDAAGYAHYVTKIASIANGQAVDSRPVSPILALDDRFLPVKGTAAAATKLATTRKINGVAFDGTTDISVDSDWSQIKNVPAASYDVAGVVALSSSINTNSRTIAATAQQLFTAHSIATNAQAKANAALPADGTAAAATKLATPRKINGVAFDGTTDINLPSDFPVGAPVPYPSATPPAGWIKCNGQSFNKSAYPQLAAAYPSGVLPDLRGEFVRGWDDGRGADAGRTLLSAQGDAIRNITGRLLYGYDADTGVAADADAGALHYDTTQGVRDSQYLTWATHTANLWYPAKLDASRVVPTANENRPRNIAFNYIVRAA